MDLELWGGVECTVNRVGDRYRDQSRLLGHHDRPDDLALLAPLGLKKLRYPVLWERVAPHHPEDRDWRWSDERLAELARLGIDPIVGLIHHGSGPAYTSLIADDFAPLFTAYAQATAQRYPHVDYWTPVNEPVTTARFSTLYGTWYPHARDERLFWVALLNQVEATIGAMRVIRRVNPAAKLVQTEDLGEVHATPELAADARYLNERRWLGWDLLAGRVGPDHYFWKEAARFGLSDQLAAIRDEPCPPDIIGINHYPTSDRFLDHRLDAYALPKGSAPYHDLEAVRVLDPAPGGLEAALRQAWERYRLPVAVTECHLGCTRDEQMRWLAQCWETCADLRVEGVDVRAVTAWALFGSMDWDSLLTLERDHYEPGVFDIRGDRPRPTALAGLLERLGRGERHSKTEAAVLSGTGWWRRDIRLEHPAYPCATAAKDVRWNGVRSPIIVLRDDRPLADTFAGAASIRDLPIVLVEGNALDLSDAQQVERLLDVQRPWAVIDARHWIDIDEMDRRPSDDRRRALESATLTAACAARDIRYVTFPSSGRLGETHRGLAIATDGFFSPQDERNLASRLERALPAGKIFPASDDRAITPTYVPDLVHAVLDLLIDGERGVWRPTSGEALTPFAFARRLADALGFDGARVVAQPHDVPEAGRTPDAAASVTTEIALLPALDDALARHAAVRLRGARAVLAVTEAAADLNPVLAEPIITVAA